MEAIEGLITVWSQHDELLAKDKIVMLLTANNDRHSEAILSNSWCVEGITMSLATKSGHFFKSYPDAEHQLTVIFNAISLNSIYSGTAFMEDFSEALPNRAIFNLCGTTPLQSLSV